MPRGSPLTPEIKRDIFKIYNEDRKQRAKEVLEKLHEKLGRDDWPKLSIIQAEIKKINDREKEQIESGEVNLDKPWHLGLLDEKILSAEVLQYFTPEALLQISRVQKHTDKIQESFNKAAEIFNKTPDKAFIKIGEAKWIARIYKVALEYIPKKLKKGLDPEEVHLLRWACAYATHERICSLSGTDFDTCELDKFLRQGADPFVVSNQYAIYNENNRTFLVDPNTAQILRDEGMADIKSTKIEVAEQLVDQQLKEIKRGRK